MHEQYQTYNGWSNRETWLASLWLCNDPASEVLLRKAQKAGNSTLARANWLEDRLNEVLDERSAEASLWTDLLRTAFCRINWVEVVEKS